MIILLVAFSLLVALPIALYRIWREKREKKRFDNDVKDSHFNRDDLPKGR